MKSPSAKSVAAFSLVEIMIGLVVLVLVADCLFGPDQCSDIDGENVSLNASSKNLRVRL